MTDDILVHIARFLPTAKDLSALGLTCPRFAAKMIPAPVSAAAAAGVASGEAAAPEMLSIMEEAGRFWVTCCSVQERGWVACREPESWLGLMHDVELLLAPLAFGRAHADFTLSEGGAVATMSGEDSFQPASSKVVMRSGRHFAQFTVMEGDMMNLGVIRPDWDVEGGESAYTTDGHCFYATDDGVCLPGYTDWEGTHTAREEGDRIGMLLDLGQGSMTFWKNDEKLGVMKAEGLSGPYCWAAEMIEEGTSTRIESAPAPASPTEEEMAAANAWQRRRRGSAEMG